MFNNLSSTKTSNNHFKHNKFSKTALDVTGSFIFVSCSIFCVKMFNAGHNTAAPLSESLESDPRGL